MQQLDRLFSKGSGSTMMLENVFEVHPLNVSERLRWQPEWPPPPPPAQTMESFTRPPHQPPRLQLSWPGTSTSFSWSDSWGRQKKTPNSDCQATIVSVIVQFYLTWPHTRSGCDPTQWWSRRCHGTGPGWWEEGCTESHPVDLRTNIWI